MRAFRVFALLFLIWVSNSLAAAQPIRFWHWYPDKAMVPILIPARASESPEQAVENYIIALERSPDLFELYDGRPPVFVAGDRIEEVRLETTHAQALLIGNKGADITDKSPRVQKFRDAFFRENASSALLPLGVTSRFSRTERQLIYSKISQQYDVLVAMGGEDVAPRFYKKPNIFAKNTNETRDLLEIELIRFYVAQEKGFFLGICRGSQIASVALGLELIQDLPFAKGESVQHQDSWHQITLKATGANILSSVLSQQDGSKMFVNSIHHQAVRFSEHTRLELSAIAEDGTTEATEFKNGKGLLLQFHPELMGNDLGQKILSRVISLGQSVKRKSVSATGKSCRAVFGHQ